MKERLSFSQLPKGLVRTMFDMENHLADSQLPNALLELVRMRVSQLNGCAYCLDMHHKEAIAAGVSPLKLYTLPAWRESPAYDTPEQLALALAEALTKLAGESPQDDVLDRALTHFGAEDFSNLCLAITQINSWNRLAIACRFRPGEYSVAA